MDELQGVIRTALEAPANATGYALNEAVRRAYPDRYVLQTSDGSFDIATFAKRSGVEVVIHEWPAPELPHRWKGPSKGIVVWLDKGHSTIAHEGAAFEVFSASWMEGYNRVSTKWIVGPSQEATYAFATRVAEVANEVRGEVLVFANGCWNRSTELHEAIKDSTFDNLVLPVGMAEELRADFRWFLAARDQYKRYGAPWKRGVLFVGPPGNGKTHCVKALLNELEIPCLYAQSFEAPYTNPQNNVHEVFERARRTTPCALVLEDLDSLVSEKTRSFFLNELDGFARNEGIVTLATTNHPERLDPAILDRPSRFDRKYNFGLPAEPERLTYLQHWNAGVEEPSQLADSALQDISAATGGFSYAYVKELMLSSLMTWVSDPTRGELRDVIDVQIANLRAQMTSSTLPVANARRYVQDFADDAVPDGS